MPTGVRIFLVYAFGILAVIGLSLRFVIDMAISAPVSLPGVVVMILLAYTIFTITVVLQRKEIARGLALGLASLTHPGHPARLLQLHGREHGPRGRPVLRGAGDPAVPRPAPTRGPRLLRPAVSRARPPPRARLAGRPARSLAGCYPPALHVRPPVHSGRPRARRATLRLSRRRRQDPACARRPGPSRHGTCCSSTTRKIPRRVVSSSLPRSAGASARRGSPTTATLPEADDGSADVVVGLLDDVPGARARASSPRPIASSVRTAACSCVHDYGRDDVSRLRGDLPEYGAWSRRDGPYLGNGFRVRVIHCFWTFDVARRGPVVPGRCLRRGRADRAAKRSAARA